MIYTNEQLIEEGHAVLSEIRDAAWALTDEQIDRPNTIGGWSGRDVQHG